MARELGAFKGYAKNAEHMLRVVRNHRRAANGATDGYEQLSTKPVPLNAIDMPEMATRACSIARGNLG